MTHVFISYSHKDDIHLKNFVHKLKQAGFKDAGDEKDIWIDSSGIEGGEDWRNEIDTALEESFAVVVLLTKNSVQSNFVLYEWAWALGNNIRVIPVLIEEISDLPSDFKHPLYERKQYKNWNVSSDQEYIIKQLKDLQQLSPLDAFLGRAISDIILPARILSYIVLWCYPYANSNLHIVTHDDFTYLLEHALNETISCYVQRLRDFWLDKSSAFNRKQTRIYATLVQELAEFWNMLSALKFVTQHGFREDIPYLNDKYEEEFVSQLIPKLIAFQEKHLNRTLSSLNADDVAFDQFKSILLNVSNKQSTIEQIKTIKFFSWLDLNVLSQDEQEHVEKVINSVIQQ